LIVRGEVIGVMVTQHYSDPEYFKKNDLNLLISVSDQVALAIDRKQSQEEIKRKEKITQTLFSISNAVNITPSLNDLYQMIHSLLGEIFDVTNFFIALLDNKRSTLHFPYYEDITDDYYDTIENFDPEESLTGLVVSKRKPILLTTAELIQLSDKESIQGTTSLIWMGVPLMIKDEVIGIISVQSYTDPHLYNKEDLKILASISDQVAIAIDRKRTEDELRKSERIHRFFMDNAPIGMSMINLDREFTYINKKLEAITGYDRSELLHKSFEHLVHPEDLSIVRDEIPLRYEGKMTSVPYEMRIYHKDGKIVWIRVISESILDNINQKLIGLQSFVEDITDQKSVQDSLKISEGRLKTILEANPDPMIVYNLNGYPEYLNPSFNSVFGWSLDELRDKTIPFVPKNQKKKTIQKIRGIYRYGVPLTFETQRYTKNKVRLDILVSAAVHKDEQGTSIGMVVNLKDITEQNRTREMIIQSEKMLSVGGLAAGMAHEINNPLAGMIQNANVIKSRLGNIDMPANLNIANELGIKMEDIKAFMTKREIFRMIDAIHDCGSRAADIVGSMLNFARISDSNISSHYLDQLMDKTIELAATDYDFKKQHDFKSIEIIKKYENDLPMLPCEGTKIQQVLLNILRNGAQSMQNSKTKKPKFVLRIYPEEKSEMICIEIEDNGPGMDEVTRSKIFEPFFTTKPVGVGTGLGLSVSYFIITKNHKGTLDVISELGEGSTFIIRLPVQRTLND